MGLLVLPLLALMVGAGRSVGSHSVGLLEYPNKALVKSMEPPARIPVDAINPDRAEAETRGTFVAIEKERNAHAVGRVDRRTNELKRVVWEIFASEKGTRRNMFIAMLLWDKRGNSQFYNSPGASL